MKRAAIPQARLNYLPALLALLCTSLQAQQAQSVQQVQILAAPLVEEIRFDAWGNNSAVLDARQLRDLNAVDLAAALRTTPGVQISRFNPVGAFGGNEGGGVFIRGMGASRPGAEIRTSVDGMPVYMPVWNHPLLDLLPLHGMQEIEVRKSPQPAFAQGFASIELRPLRAREDGWHGSARLSAGGLGTRIAQASLLGKLGSGDSATRITLAPGFARSDGSRANGDGRLSNLLASVEQQFDPHWQLKALLLHSDNQAGDAGDMRSSTPSQARYETRATHVALTLRHQHEALRGSLQLAQGHGSGNWLQQGAPDGDTLTSFTQRSLRWREETGSLARGLYSFGLEAEWQEGLVSFKRLAPAPQDSLQPPKMHLYSPWLGWSQRMALADGWQLQPAAGLRSYQHSQFANSTSPYLGLQAEQGAWRWFANGARGRNYPGLEAPLLASLIPPLGQSWKSLQAESLTHAEIGFSWSPAAQTRLDFSLFNDRFSGRYQFGFPPAVTPPAFVNLGDYRGRGAELGIRHGWRDWNLFAALTLLEANRSGLPYLPRQALTLGLNGRLQDVRLSLDAQCQASMLTLNSARVAGSVNTESVGGFCSMNARAAYPLAALGKQGEVFLALENLGKKTYAFRPGYPMPGRWAQLGLQAGW